MNYIDYSFTEVSVHDLGTYCLEILIPFLRGDAESFNDKVKYSYNDNFSCISYHSKYGAYPIISNIKNYTSNINYKTPENIIVLLNNKVLISNILVDRISTEQFLEEEFALSTIFDDKDLRILKLSTYLYSIPLEFCKMSIDMNSLFLAYFDNVKN